MIQDPSLLSRCRRRWENHGYSQTPRDSSRELEGNVCWGGLSISARFHGCMFRLLRVCTSVSFYSLRSHIYFHSSLAPAAPSHSPIQNIKDWQTYWLPLGGMLSPNSQVWGAGDGNQGHFIYMWQQKLTPGRKSLEKKNSRMTRHIQKLCVTKKYRPCCFETVFFYVSPW